MTTTHRRFRRPLLLVAILLLASCGGGEPTTAPDPADHPIAMFYNGSFFYGGCCQGNNGHAILTVLQGQGFPVDTFGAIDGTTLTQVLPGKEILVVPPRYYGVPRLSDSLTPAARTAITGFVNAGGTVVVVGGSESVFLTHALLDSLFGFAIAPGTTVELYDDQWLPRASGAAGTPFASAPDSLAARSSTWTLSSASLPAGSKVIYPGLTAADAAVVLIPYGAGRILYVGHDWYGHDAVADAGWDGILLRLAAF